MKSFALFAIIALSLTASGQNLSKKQAQKDLKYLYKSIEKIHPELYWFYPKDSADIYFSNMINNLENSVSEEKLFLIASEFITKFNSSHLGTTLPLLTLGDFSKSKTLNPLPLDLTFNSKGIYVKGDITGESQLNVGDQILSINGNNTDLIFKEFQKIAKSVRNFDVWPRYSKFFMEYYRLQFGDTCLFNFEYISFKTKDTLSSVMNSIPDYQWGQYFMANFPKEKFWFDFYKEQNIGVIKITSFANLNGFDAFLESTFKQIKELCIEHLIIDIRNNEGGNTVYVDELLNYATTKSYRYDDYYIAKVSQEKRDDVKQHLINHSKEQQAELLNKYKLNWLFDNEVGDSVVFSGKQVVHIPAEKDDKFNGKLYLLINERVGSTSHLFAQAFKCSNLGVVIGQETGEATIFYGDGPTLKLPNSKIEFSVASKKFVSHCEASTTQGIIPDYTVDYSPSKLLNEEDEVLDFTINLITK